jgi:hypothetical protein
MLLFFGKDPTLEGFYGNLAAILGGVALAIMIISTRAQIFLIGESTVPLALLGGAAPSCSVR